MSALFERVRHGDERRAPARLLIEIPHGATTREHYDAVARRLKGELPDQLESFFFVNTDVGAPESGAAIARGLARHSVLVLRCLVPRTFVDCNRRLQPTADGVVREGITQGLPAYIKDPEDVRWLQEQHRAYGEAARQAYAEVCGHGGLALTLHTYAPRSVEIERVDERIVEQLRSAYRTENYPRWKPRPEVEVISETVDGRCLAPPAVVEDLSARYAEIGIRLARNESYRLHPATRGFEFSERYPGQVLCVELNRGGLADPFRPFVEMPLSSRKIERLTGPLVEALGAALAVG